MTGVNRVWSLDVELWSTVLSASQRETRQQKREVGYLLVLGLAVISCNMGNGCGSFSKQFAFEEWFENIHFNKVHWGTANKTQEKDKKKIAYLK